MSQKTKIEAGASFTATVPFGHREHLKVHIDYVLPSKCYSDVTLVVYRVFGKHKQWWHQFMCTMEEMEYYIEDAKNNKSIKIRY